MPGKDKARCTTMMAASVLLSVCAPSGPDHAEWAGAQADTITCEPWAKVTQGPVIHVNNVWNEQAAGDFDWSQCIVTDPAAPARHGFTWRWPPLGQDIYAQPQARIGVSPWDPLPKLDDRFPVRIGTLQAMTVAANVAYDGPSELNVVSTLWLTDTDDLGDEAQPESIVAEVMVWLDATDGHMSPAGRKVGTVEQGRMRWDIWLDEDWHDVSGVNDNRWIYIALVAQAGSPSAHFDPVALLRSEPLAHLQLDRAFIADVELGSEIMRGEGVLWIDRFDVAFVPR